jgi:hypothetical protein
MPIIFNSIKLAFLFEIGFSFDQVIFKNQKDS